MDKKVIYLITGCWIFFQGSDGFSCGVASALEDRSHVKKWMGNQDRIINGQNVLLGHHPWLVKICFSHGFQCTGTIISNLHVLTAKHCMESYGDPQVLYGHVVIEEMQKINVTFVYYPGRVEDIFGSDIAILELSESLEFSELVAPICLSRSSELQMDETAVVAGFGIMFIKVGKVKADRTDNETEFVPVRPVNVVGVPTSVAQWNKVRIIENTECRCKCQNNEADLRDLNEICAGDFMSGTTIGDSGGPLMIIRDNRWILSGITSRGRLLVKKDNSTVVFDKGVYTDVSYFCDWIEEKTNRLVNCI